MTSTGIGEFALEEVKLAHAKTFNYELTSIGADEVIPIMLQQRPNKMYTG